MKRYKRGEWYLMRLLLTPMDLRKNFSIFIQRLRQLKKYAKLFFSNIYQATCIHNHLPVLLKWRKANSVFMSPAFEAMVKPLLRRTLVLLEWIAAGRKTAAGFVVGEQ